MSAVVCFTANNRPQYLAETLESWSKVRGVGDAHLIFRCEPGHPEVARLCAEAGDFAGKVTVIVNDQRYGALGNPWHAFESGFAHSDFVVLAEDDSPVSDDILEWFAWAGAEYAASEKVLAMCAFRRHRAPGGPHACQVTTAFRPTVWATWRDRWENLLRDDWDHDYRHKGWDWRIIEHWIGELGYRVAVPCESRAQVSGEFGGTHLQPGQMYLDHLSDCFSPRYEPGEFTEVSCESS